MFHAVIIPIATCFIYTSYHFYAFSGTNLLTRCRSVSSCFLLFFSFRKASRKIFSELDENQRVQISHRKTPEARRGDGVGPRGSHATLVCGRGWARAQPWRGRLGCLPTPPFRLYIPDVPKTLKTPIIFHEKFRRRRRRQP